MGWNSVHLVGALALCAVANRAPACDLPSLPVIPAQQAVGARADQARADTGVYFKAMREYASCVQADLKAAGGDAAPADVKAALVARNNAAVAEAQAVQKLFEERIGGGKTGTPSSEAAARKLADELLSGKPDYDWMTPEMARATREQLGSLRNYLVSRGSVIQSVEFAGVDAQGREIYLVRQEKGTSGFTIGLDKTGRLNFALVGPADKGR